MKKLSAKINYQPKLIRQKIIINNFLAKVSQRRHGPFAVTQEDCLVVVMRVISYLINDSTRVYFDNSLKKDEPIIIAT